MDLWDALLRYAPLVMPAAVLLGAAAAYVGVDRTLRQKAATDRRHQAWLRLEWAVEQTLRPDRARQALGVAALRALLLAPGRLDEPDEAVLEFALVAVRRVRDGARASPVRARAQHEGRDSDEGRRDEGVSADQLAAQAGDTVDRLEEHLRRARSGDPGRGA